jgi:NAD(P)-dependent dehydrogenase (short-subunit alcohol dehydrogenase family)
MSTDESTADNADRIALVTGGSRGLGRALAAALVGAGWRVIIDGRDAGRLGAAARDMSGPETVVAIPGDVTEPGHLRQLDDAVAAAGGLDLLVNNASVLGPSPQPSLADYPRADLERVYAVNLFAPLALFQLLVPHLVRRSGCVVNLSSDAAVEPYEGWGGYGSSKAALDQVTAVLGAEHPALRVYAFDPGDMATDLHQQAFPGEDISDRASPESVLPSLMALIDGALPSGRYRAADIALPVAR